MKKQTTILIVLILMGITSLFGQEKKNETYVFLNANEIKSVNKYVTALKTADMTQFRFQSKRNIIEFENGLKVELFSADELTQKGYTVDTRKLLTVAPKNTYNYTFGLSADGKTIIQKFTAGKMKH